MTSLETILTVALVVVSFIGAVACFSAYDLYEEVKILRIMLLRERTDKEK